MSLEDTLASTAEKIVVHGTRSERIVLEAAAAAARSLCPGAAAALTDWNAPEITRLRAFGIVHGALLGANVAVDVPEVLGMADAASSGRAA